VPLRSVEAATRDDAIAAAREQFGPHARVVGVRRVRSGGVLGFFATERYVAEVADQFVRPGLPTPSTGSSPAAPVSSFDSPLASATPARARAAAPARNGAAAWAAEAARSGDARSGDAVRGPGTGSRPAASAAPDHDRLDELAGLLGGLPAAAPRPSTTSSSRTAAAASRPAAETPVASGPPRATFPRATTTKSARPAAPTPLEESAPVVSPFAAALESAGAPSPFTAALARMVSSDREVRQAVAQALEEPGIPAIEEPPPSAPEPAAGSAEHPVDVPDTPAPRPSLAAAIRSADSSTRSRTVHQEEIPVGEQVVTAPSTSQSAPVLPTWAAEEEIAVPTASTRQEEIAETLRAALAQGHSDEALAGILRKMLAGDSPQEILPEPGAVEPAAVVIETPPVAEIAAELPVLAETPDETPAPVEAPTGVVTPAEPVAALPEPASAAPVSWTPAASVAPAVPLPAPTWDLVSSNHSLFGPPVPPTGSTGLGWDVPAPRVVDTPLWGEPASAAAPAATGSPIWAEVVLSDPAPAPVPELPAVEPMPAAALFETPREEPVLPVPDADPVAVVAAPSVAAEAERTQELAAGTTTEAAGELAPLLARTASDPAPMSMTMDATTVMPRISTLPSRAGSRGHGLPPVPPSTSRPPVPPSRSARTEKPEPADVEDADRTSASAPQVRAPRAPRALATVTRLPVAPLMAGPDVLDMHELDDEADDVATTAAQQAATEVTTRLTGLGLPEQLLGPDFADALTTSGTYAALTRALARHLPEVPATPSGAGEVLFVVGPGLETLRAAQSLAATLRLDPDRVQWATRGDLAGLAPQASRVTTIDAAVDRRQEAAESGTLTIVAVDAPLRADTSWMSRMLEIWAPAAVWAVVEATRKPEDVEAWLDGLVRVDALAVQDTDLSADPAAVLRRLTLPVALLDGVRATPHRWASLLCERLEDPQA
jgi:hypothetical protein